MLDADTEAQMREVRRGRGAPRALWGSFLLVQLMEVANAKGRQTLVSVPGKAWRAEHVMQ